MIILTSEDSRVAEEFMLKAAEVAKNATCQRAKCGTVIVAKGEIIGTGFNSPPGEQEDQRRCENRNFSNRFKSDRTCCVHAEQRAVMYALKNNPEKIKGSVLYFTRVDGEGNVLKSGEPYCTICSKMALDSGVGEFVLWQKDGIVVFDTKEYNELSFSY